MRQNPEGYFKAMLESVDTEIGRLLDSLDDETRANTLVFVIGDNGTGGRVVQSPYKEIGAKGSLHVGGIQTPMVAFSPYSAGGGTRYDSLISTIDFFPTILELFGQDSQLVLQGASFAPLISGDVAGYQPNSHVFSQSLEAVTVRSAAHKLIRLDSGEELFYDIADDPFEQNNLMTSSDLSDDDQTIHSELSGLLDGFLE